MQKKQNSKRERNNLAEAQSKSPGPAQQAMRAQAASKRPTPRESIAKAQEAFKDFSLSKHPKGSLPANHVSEGQEKDRAAVYAVQKAVITRTLRTLSYAGPTTQGMTLDLPIEQIKNALPSYDDQARTVELSDVLALVSRKMSGTEFYSLGNPTLNRLALQSRVDQIMQSVKQGANKDEQ